MTSFAIKNPARLRRYLHIALLALAGLIMIFWPIVALYSA